MRVSLQPYRCPPMRCFTQRSIFSHTPRKFSRDPKPNDPPKPKKMIKSIYRQSIFPAKRLESESDIDAYVEQMRKQLLAYMKGSDGIDLK